MTQKKGLFEEMERIEYDLDDEMAAMIMEFNMIGKLLNGRYLDFDPVKKKQCLELFYKSLEIRNSKLLIEYTPVASGLVGMNGQSSRLEFPKSQSENGLVGSESVKNLYGGQDRIRTCEG